MVLNKGLETCCQKNLCFDVQNCNVTDEYFSVDKNVYMNNSGRSHPYIFQDFYPPGISGKVDAVV